MSQFYIAAQIPAAEFIFVVAEQGSSIDAITQMRIGLGLIVPVEVLRTAF
jgi:hypothetical protein